MKDDRRATTHTRPPDDSGTGSDIIERVLIRFDSSDPITRGALDKWLASYNDAQSEQAEQEVVYQFSSPELVDLIIDLELSGML